MFQLILSDIHWNRAQCTVLIWQHFPYVLPVFWNLNFNLRCVLGLMKMSVKWLDNVRVLSCQYLFCYFTVVFRSWMIQHFFMNRLSQWFKDPFMKFWANWLNERHDLTVICRHTQAVLVSNLYWSFFAPIFHMIIFNRFYV